MHHVIYASPPAIVLSVRKTPARHLCNLLTPAVYAGATRAAPQTCNLSVHSRCCTVQLTAGRSDPCDANAYAY